MISFTNILVCIYGRYELFKNIPQYHQHTLRIDNNFIFYLKSNLNITVKIIVNNIKFTILTILSVRFVHLHVVLTVFTLLYYRSLELFHFRKLKLYTR